MTTLPSSVTDRTRALPARKATPTAETPDVGAVLHLAGTLINTAHAFLLPLAALFAGLFALGLQVNAVLYGASVFLARGALVFVGIWLVVWAVRTGFRAVITLIAPQETPATGKAGKDAVTPEVSRPKLALPVDAPAHRYGETLNS